MKRQNMMNKAFALTDYRLVKPYGEGYFGLQWFRQWLLIWLWHSSQGKVYFNIEESNPQIYSFEMATTSKGHWVISLIYWRKRNSTAYSMVLRPFKSISQIAKSMGPTWGSPGSCRPQLGPMLAPWTLLSGILRPEGNGRHFANILKHIFLRAKFVCGYKFRWHIFLSVELIFIQRRLK